MNAKKTTTKTAEPVKPTETTRGRCVVDDGRCVGGAVNGKVCSYHAMQYDRNGRKRGRD